MASQLNSTKNREELTPVLLKLFQKIAEESSMTLDLAMNSYLFIAKFIYSGIGNKRKDKLDFMKI